MITAPINRFFNHILIVLAFSATLVFSGCEPELIDDQIPIVDFEDVVINLNLPSYSALLANGGFVYLNDIGVRGVTLYRKTSTEYLAYERNCTFQPGDACATVEVHSSSLFMHDVCCGSSFSFDNGAPTGGPAWRNLRQYFTSLSGSTLTITSEVVN